MKLFKKVFGSKKNSVPNVPVVDTRIDTDVVSQETAKEEIPVKVIEPVKPPVRRTPTLETHDFKLDAGLFILGEGDYGWTYHEYKKVIITHPERFVEREITVPKLVWAFSGSGHTEWEYLLATWIVRLVKEALEKGESEVDVSDVFNKNFTCRNASRVWEQPKVLERVLPWFNDDREETEDCLKMAFSGMIV